MDAATLQRLRALAEGAPAKRMPEKQFSAYLDDLYANNKFFRETADRLEREGKVRNPRRVAYYIGIRTGGWPSPGKKGTVGASDSDGRRDSHGRFKRRSETPEEDEADEQETPSALAALKKLDWSGIDKIKKGLRQIGIATTDYYDRLAGDLTYGRKGRRVRPSEDDLDKFKRKRSEKKAVEKPWKSSIKPSLKPFKPKKSFTKRKAK